MHELGLMTGVMDSVTVAALEAGADRVLEVSLSVGEMTEAIEDALQFAFQVLCEQDPLFKDAKLNVTMIPAKSRCLECGNVFVHDRYHMLCPKCGGFTELIEGKELRIDSIEVDIPDDKEKPERAEADVAAGMPDGKEA
jgi:hydrogenase nickel incorporation protein HypA/HybF